MYAYITKGNNGCALLGQIAMVGTHVFVQTRFAALGSANISEFTMHYLVSLSACAQDRGNKSDETQISFSIQEVYSLS